MSTKSFYPNLGTLMSLDDFPEELQFLENGLQNALDNIYYKNLQYVKSEDGSQAYYNLVLVTGEALQLDLFNTGFSLVLNPDSTGETLIPLNLNYNWPVLALIKSFRLQDFSYLPQDVQSLLNQSLSLSDTDLVLIATESFENNTNLAAYQSLVDKINQQYNLSGTDQINYPNEGEALNMAYDIQEAIRTHASLNESIEEIINQVYIINVDNNIYTQNLNQLSYNLPVLRSPQQLANLLHKKEPRESQIIRKFVFKKLFLCYICLVSNFCSQTEQTLILFSKFVA